MTMQWIADVPNSTNSLFGVADSGINNPIAIDAELRVHIAFVSTVASGGANTLTYAIGTPDGPLQIFGHQPFVMLRQYQWHFFPVVPPSEWGILSLFDLALDSQGRAHLCFSGEETDDHALEPDLKYAVWDETNRQFDISVVQSFSFASGLAMTIAKDDSVHIAFSDATGLHYATRARDSDPFAMTPVDKQPANISDLSIAVGSAGQIGISYLFQLKSVNNVVNAFQLRFARITSTGWILDTADPGPLNGGTWVMDLFHPGANSLVIDANGVPHIAYISGSLGLRHGTWGAGGPGFWVTGAFGYGELVDAMGQATSAKILLDSNDVLHIAYQAQTQTGTSELRHALRSPAGGWGTQTVDPSNNCGWGASAALGPNAMPHIAYGFTPIVSGLIALKHAYLVNTTLIPIPRPHKKRPILKRPGM